MGLRIFHRISPHISHIPSEECYDCILILFFFKQLDIMHELTFDTPLRLIWRFDKELSRVISWSLLDLYGLIMWEFGSYVPYAYPNILIRQYGLGVKRAWYLMFISWLKGFLMPKRWCLHRMGGLKPVVTNVRWLCVSYSAMLKANVGLTHEFDIVGEKPSFNVDFDSLWIFFPVIGSCMDLRGYNLNLSRPLGLDLTNK